MQAPPHAQALPVAHTWHAPCASAGAPPRLQLALGLFLLTTKLTGNTGLGLAALCAGFLVNIAMLLCAPDYAGDKSCLAFWAVLQATLGGLAFMNEK